MDDDDWADGPESEVTKIDAWGAGEIEGIDEALIRWTTFSMAQGYKDSEIRRRLREYDLDRRLTQEDETPICDLRGCRRTTFVT